MKKLIVSDVMTRDPISVKPDTNLFDCAKTLVKKKIGTLLLVEKKKKLAGILSETDILWAITKKKVEDLKKIKAIDISPKKIAVIKPDMTIEETIKKMKKQKITKFPVIHQGELVGLVTMKDILNFHPEFYPEFEEFARIREESKKLKRIKSASKTRDGICDYCGQRKVLYDFNGMAVCENCREKL